LSLSVVSHSSRHQGVWRSSLPRASSVSLCKSLCSFADYFLVGVGLTFSLTASPLLITELAYPTLVSTFNTNGPRARVVGGMPHPARGKPAWSCTSRGSLITIYVVSAEKCRAPTTHAGTSGPSQTHGPFSVFIMTTIDSGYGGKWSRFD
jgi:hypothetical protein